MLATLAAGFILVTAPARARPAETPCSPEGQAAPAPDLGSVTASGALWDVDPLPSAEDVAPYRPPGFPKMVLLDVGHVLTSPIRWRDGEWAAFSASVGALAALSLADESISDTAREHGPTLGFVGDTLEGLGDGRSFLLLGGFYLVGAIGDDSKAKNVFFDGLSASLIASGIITPVLSTLVGRSVVHLNKKLRSGEKEPESAGIRVSVLPFVDGATLGATASLDF